MQGLGATIVNGIQSNTNELFTWKCQKCRTRTVARAQLFFFNTVMSGMALCIPTTLNTQGDYFTAPQHVLHAQ